MREKDRLNLSKLNALVETTDAKSIFTLGTKGLQGAGSGLAAAGLIMTVLALAGITVAMIFEIVVATAGAALFGALAMIGSGYQLWREFQKIAKEKQLFDQKLSTLNESIIESIKNYQLIDELTENLQLEVNRLQAIATDLYDQEEQRKIRDQLQSLSIDIEHLEQNKQDLVARLKVSLNIVSGASYEEKILHLFEHGQGSNAKKALQQFAYINLHWQEKELTNFDVGLDKIWPHLRQPLAQDNRVLDLEKELQAIIKPRPPKPHSGMQKLAIGLTAIGGFLGGVGATVAVGALVFGGMAALLSVGWPVAVVVGSVGLLTMTGALVYHRYIEKKQEQIVTKLDLAMQQVTGMHNYLDENVKSIQRTLQAIESKYQHASNAIAIRLDEHEKTVRDYKKLMHSTVVDIKKLDEETRFFKTYTPLTLHTATELKKAIEGQVIVLEMLKDRVKKIAVTAGSEEKKHILMHEIDVLTDIAKKSKADVLKIHHKVDVGVHQKKAVLNHVKPVPITITKKGYDEENEDEKKLENLDEKEQKLSGR